MDPQAIDIGRASAPDQDLGVICGEVTSSARDDEMRRPVADLGFNQCTHCIAIGRHASELQLETMAGNRRILQQRGVFLLICHNHVR